MQTRAGRGAVWGGGPRAAGDLTPANVSSIVVTAANTIASVANAAIRADAQRELGRIQAETSRRLAEVEDGATRAALLAQLQEQAQRLAQTAATTGGQFRDVATTPPPATGLAAVPWWGWALAGGAVLATGGAVVVFSRGRRAGRRRRRPR